jgi:hypothetical protein
MMIPYKIRFCRFEAQIGDFGLYTTTNSVMIALGDKAILTASIFGRARNSDRISIRQHHAIVIEH